MLGALVVDMQDRMRACRAAGARSIWELPDKLRPVPVVVIVDEIAELYLSDGTPREQGRSGAVLHLPAAPGAARRRARHAPGRRRATRRLRPRARCHRAARPARRPDLPPRQRPRHGRDDPGRPEQGRRSGRPVDHGGRNRAWPSCTGPDGGWSRARSHLTTTEEAAATAAEVRGHDPGTARHRPRPGRPGRR